MTSPPTDRRLRLRDALLAVVVTALLLTDAILAPGDEIIREVPLIIAALALGECRRFPRVVLLITVACVSAYSLYATPALIASLPVLIAVTAAVGSGHRLLTAAVVGPILLVTLVGGLINSEDGQTVRESFQLAVLPIGWFVAAGVMGEASRQHRAYVRQVEQRALEAERTREEMARRRAADERLRIARDLHDSLTHSISVIKVQAGVAVHLARKRGEEVPEALAAIQEASGAATRELRETLDVLRETTGPARTSRLAGLPELLTRTRAAGVPATLTTSGEQRALSAAVDTAAYRIIQEALTNAARHAGAGATAAVTVEYGDERVVLCVENDGGPVDAPVPGKGLTGMAERAAALGGELEAGPREGGGFRVRAVLPLVRTAEAVPS